MMERMDKNAEKDNFCSKDLSKMNRDDMMLIQER